MFISLCPKQFTMTVQTYPAYEKWLIRAATELKKQNTEINVSVESIITSILQRDCLEQHEMAFDIVGSINEDGSIDAESFNGAAKVILERN
jgi:serine protease inhibitor ecotin